MAFGIFPKYEDIFPGIQLPDLDEVLSRTSSKDLLKAVAFMNSKVHLSQTNLAEQEDILWKWIYPFAEPTRFEVKKNYILFKKHTQRQGHQVILFASATLLRLTERIILNFNDLPEKHKKDIEDEMALFEAWLIINSIFDADVVQGLDPVIANLPDMLLVNQASQYEFIHTKDVIYQTLLANSFFVFLSENEKLKNYLVEFLANKQVKNPNEYLSHLLTVYGEGISGRSFGFGIPDEAVHVIPFFDSIAYDLAAHTFSDLAAKHQPDSDFKLLRSRPLIKEVNGNYYPLHNNFFVDKIYQGLLFDFFQHSSIKATHKTFGDFLQLLGQDFAESHLFYGYVAECFPQKKYVVTVPGNQFNEFEYSDYYARQGNKLFLFEFKNSIMNAQVKQSRDAARIKAEIFKKLVYSPDNNRRKGAGQLINVIQNIEEGGFEFDDFAAREIRSLIIYPIIVYTDDFFSLDGIQNIVSDEFSKLLKERPVRRHKVRNVTLVHLRDIIDMQFLIQSSKTTISDIMQVYFTRKKDIIRKRPRNQQEHLAKLKGFHSIMHDIVLPYSDKKALLKRLATALDFNTPRV